jgi:hypothetical protein
MADKKAPTQSEVGKATAILARLPTYFHPGAVLVVGDEEPDDFFFTVGFMLTDSEVYALRSEKVSPEGLEYKSRVKTIGNTGDLKDIDLIIYSEKTLSETSASKLLSVIKKHNAKYCLLITESEGKVREKFYQFDITTSSPLSKYYFPTNRAVYLVRSR